MQYLRIFQMHTDQERTQEGKHSVFKHGKTVVRGGVRAARLKSLLDKKQVTALDVTECSEMEML